MNTALVRIEPWTGLLYAGIFVLLFGAVWIYLLSLRTSPLWFLACLIAPPLLVVFAVLHSGRTAVPALICVFGGVCAYAAQLQSGGAVTTELLIAWALIVPTTIAESLGHRLPIP